jgi:hypothetical protein
MNALAVMPFLQPMDFQQQTAGCFELTPSRPIPVKRLERYVKYRNQAFGETTQKFRITEEGLIKPTKACSTPEVIFCQLLTGAGILTESSIFAAIHESSLRNLPLIRTIGSRFKISRKVCLSIHLLVEKIQAEAITFNQAVLATHHMIVFRTELTEALAHVSSLAQFSIISFLQVSGTVSDDDLYRVTEGNWIEPNRLAKMLVAANIIDTHTMRNATRLLYWLKAGICSFERTNQLMFESMRSSMDVEDCCCDQTAA